MQSVSLNIKQFTFVYIRVRQPIITCNLSILYGVACIIERHCCTCVGFNRLFFCYHTNRNATRRLVTLIAYSAILEEQQRGFRCKFQSYQVRMVGLHFLLIRKNRIRYLSINLTIEMIFQVAYANLFARSQRNVNIISVGFERLFHARENLCTHIFKLLCAGFGIHHRARRST